jgi:hypothetical protein
MVVFLRASAIKIGSTSSPRTEEGVGEERKKRSGEKGKRESGVRYRELERES